MKKILILFLIYLVSSNLFAQPNFTISSMYKHSIVKVIGGMQNVNSELKLSEEGSGVVISPDGAVLTARHILYDEKGNLYQNIGFMVVEKNANPNLSSKTYYESTLVFEDINNDLALLIPCTPMINEMQYTKISRTPEKYLNNFVVLISFPKNNNGFQNEDQVLLLSYNENTKLFDFDKKPELGSSGGAILNSDGELLGIVLGYKKRTIPVIFESNNNFLGNLLIENIGVALSASAFQFLNVGSDQQAYISQKAFEVKGTIFDSVTKQPVSNVVVGITKEKVNTISYANLLGSATSNEKGEFIIDNNIPNGDYFVKLIKHNYQVIHEKVSVNNQSINLKANILPLKKIDNKGLEVTVTDFLGKPIQNASFALLKQGKNYDNIKKEDCIVLGNSDSSGKIVFNQKIDDGIYPIKITANGYMTAKGNFRITPNEKGISIIKTKLYKEAR